MLCRAFAERVKQIIATARKSGTPVARLWRVSSTTERSQPNCLKVPHALWSVCGAYGNYWASENINPRNTLQICKVFRGFIWMFEA